ncbi:hypothetical protein RI367_006896 [Sorochytrium milnesiophthora]
MHLLLSILLLLCSLHCLLGETHKFTTPHAQTLAHGDSLRQLAATVSVPYGPREAGHPLNHQAGIQYNIGDSFLEASVFVEGHTVRIECHGVDAKTIILSADHVMDVKFDGTVRFTIEYDPKTSTVEALMERPKTDDKKSANLAKCSGTLNYTPGALHNITLFYSTDHNDQLQTKPLSAEARFYDIRFLTTRRPKGQQLHPKSAGENITPEWPSTSSVYPRSFATFDNTVGSLSIKHYFEYRTFYLEAIEIEIAERCIQGTPTTCAAFEALQV